MTGGFSTLFPKPRVAVIACMTVIDLTTTDDTPTITGTAAEDGVDITLTILDATLTPVGGTPVVIQATGGVWSYTATTLAPGTYTVNVTGTINGDPCSADGNLIIQSVTTGIAYGSPNGVAYGSIAGVAYGPFQ